MKKHFQKRSFLGVLFTSLTFLFSQVLFNTAYAQCVANPGVISGTVYEDINNSGSRDNGEVAVANVLVSVYNSSNQLVAFQPTNNLGEYTFSGLTDGADYKLTFSYLAKYASSFAGNDSGTDVQFYKAPKCNASLGVVLAQAQCSSNPQVFTTCFVQGQTSTGNVNAATLIGLEYNFGPSSAVSKLASHGETGSVWGVAWKSTTSQLFSSAFVKQYSGFTQHGHGAIFSTVINGNAGSTSKFVTMQELGINVGHLTDTKTSGGNPVSLTDCNYGKFVGKAGLGAMVINPSEEYLYVVNLYNKSLVKLPTVNPTAANVEEIIIPNPNCSNGDYAPFALKYYNDKIYIGVTCTEETNKSALNSMAVVYEFDPIAKTFTNIFSTNYLKGYWSDIPDDLNTQHWFTDIDFTDNGNMILSFTDRIGHKYCNTPNRLDHQFPDILMAWKDNGVWKLESNGTVGSLTGTGVNNSQGPDGGEFFGDDYWVTQPLYHPEIALGSVFVLPGSNSVVAATYDPSTNSYSGGVQRYNTTNGSKINAKELYTRESTIAFGKATGFGDIIGRCGLPNIQIGNLVWYDNNKNGIQDAGEAPVSNLTINLLDANCTQVATTTTSSTGNYTFSNLTPGTQYYLALSPSTFDKDFGFVTIANENYIFAPSVSDNALTDNNATVLTNTCSNSVISVLSSKTNHTLDIGLVKVNGFDLALKNELVNADFYRKNDIVDFRITVFNQGGVPAKNVKIVNYVPEGLMYNQGENPLWSIVGSTASTTLTETILPGSSASVIIRLRLMSNELNKVIDVAEIESATDHNGIPQTDVDSNPDNNKGNDNGGQVNSLTDNKIDDDGTLDEDDEDPAMPMIVDLALKQTLNTQCINAGDCNTITITVYNQGTVATSSFSVVNYFGNLITLGDNNPGWTLENSKLYYTNATPLNPGESTQIPLNICVREGLINSGVVNFAEISEIKVNGTATIKDYDSVPDAIANNDAGGTHDTPQDNNINGAFGVEEDDHDPVYLSVSYLDLALKLTTEKRKVSTGEDVCFTVTIYNQGSETLKEVRVVDYVPQYLQLNDENWTLNGNLANRTLTFPDGFAPGDEYAADICFVVKNIDNVYYIENVAEITGSTNICNQDVTNKDIDSKADTNEFNDLGGKPLSVTDNLVDGLPSVDEDDQDPALLINYTISKTNCQCLANATNGQNGQYAQTITIRGPRGMKWYIDQVVDFYSNSSLAPPAAPTPFATGLSGDLLEEHVLADSITSDYIISGIYQDGQIYNIVFASTSNDFASMRGDGCSYRAIPVTGTASLCTSGVQQYSVPTSPSGYSVSVTGGMILSAAIDSSNINVQWGSVPGNYTVTFKSKNPSSCSEPGILNVAIGNPHLAMACKSNIQVSLDNDCAVLITPSMIIAGTQSPDAPYIVMLTDNKGNAIPGGIVTKEHIGKTVTAKLIEGCSGNSCWGQIAVEDKTAPVIICKDTVELACFKAETYPGPIATDNCGGIVKLTTLDSVLTQLNCNPKYNQYINKKYIAIDAYGNKSKECKQTLAIKRIQLDSIKFPADIEMANALNCNKYELDEKGFPSPSVTGAPSIEGERLYPNSDKACNIGVGYTDRDFGYIGCARKIMRVWTVYEAWCTSGVIKKDTQTIIIADIKKPTFTCPKDFTVSASAGQCEGYASIPALTGITDDCSTRFTVDVKYPGGFFNNSNGGNVTLPSGPNKITYIVYDECLNRDSCSMTIHVKDNTAPTVVCIKSTTVGITSLGEGYLYASSINDGSYDACGIDSMRVRRMDLGAPCNENQDFSNIVKFCCADVSKEIMVELKVWDVQGNSNSCMVSVIVQDKTLPKITCPPNVTVSCEVDIDVNKLEQYGVATAEDICGATVRSVATANINQCRTGSIERIFTASDKNGSVRCTSYIYITRQSNDLNIVWPEDFSTTNGCTPIDLDPSNLDKRYARPTFNDGICDLVASSFTDQYFEFDGSGNACFKIIRTWTVIDWCRKDEIGYEPAEYQQLIKVTNTVDPEMDIDADTEVCTDDDSCDEGEVKLIANGDDDCTPTVNLSWKYQIDFDFDGTFEADVTNASRGGIIDASGTYPIGKHRILFVFEDRCGNQIARYHDFTIKNCKAPTPSCINGTSISLGQMNINGQLVRMACIPAQSLNVSSSHPCGYSLKYSFSSNVNDTTKCFDCTNLGRNSIALYVTDQYGNSASCATFIDVQNNDPSIVSISASKEISCAGDTVTLTAVGTGSVLWSTGQTTRSIKVTPTSPTTYTVSVTSTDFCTMSASKLIDIFPSPVGLINTSISSNGSTVCSGQSVTLTASGGVSYRWNTTPVQTTSSITVSPTANTTYVVTVTSAQGCTATASKAITVNPKPTPVIAPSSANICAGTTISLGITGLAPGTTYTYNWSTTPPQTTASISVTPSANTTYTVTVTNANGCSATATQAIVVNPLPTINIAGPSSTCAGVPITLTASGGTSYTWNVPVPNNQASITVAPTSNTTYTVTVTNASGCSATSNKSITVNPLPNAAIAGPSATCTNVPVTLTASGGATYAWNTTPVQTTPSITVTPAATTTYTVTVTSSLGCSSTASKAVTVNPLPVVTIDGPSTACAGSSITLTANPAGATSYAWNTTPALTTQSITVAPSANTTYTVTVTATTGCSASASKAVTVNPKPTVGITGDTLICVGQSTTLTASGGGTYSWSAPGSTTASITVSPAVTTVYTVTVTGANGCTSTKSQQVIVSPPNVAAISGNLGLCQGASTTLTATGGTIFAWSTGAITASITVSPASNTTYTVTVTNAIGCSDTESANVTVSPLPTFTVNTPGPICAGDPVTLTVTGAPSGSTYAWNTTPVQTTASITVSPTTTTTYIVTVTSNGCAVSTSRTITVNPKPVVNITGDLNICLNENTTLTATGGGTYLWSTNATTAAITVAPTANTTYTVTVTNSGCTNTASATVTVNLNNSPIAICQNLTVFLNAQGTISITGAQINNNSIPGCDNGTLSYSVVPSTFFCNDVTVPPSGITVTLTVTSSTGPTSTCTALVTVRDTLKPTITCPANLTVNCSNFTGLAGLPVATATDNCTSPASGSTPAFPNVTVVVLNATNVCNIGTITRTFTATDRAGNTSECTQLITVTPSTDPLTAADITFPPNITLTSCSTLAPSATGSPIVNTQNATCTRISVTFVDVNNNPSCNYTFQRNWRVVDSCQLNPNSLTAGIFTSTQQITVIDNQPPIISGYADITVNTAVCPVFVNYNMANVSITDCSTLTVTNNSPTAANPNSGNPSGFYTEGTHTIIVTAMDQCGFMTKDTFTITINLTTMVEFVVCKKIIRNITDLDFVDVHAREFVDQLQGTCNPQIHMYSYSRTILMDSVRRFPCDSLGDRIVWVYHYKNGLMIDSCKSIVTILDPNGFCTGNIFRVIGNVNTENFVPVKGVEMNLGEGMPKVFTDETGHYTIPDMIPDGDYMMQPIKDDGILEGVSTLDLIMIQRHILGSQKIQSAYRMIAADINNDNRISAADLVELRKVILGTNDKFKNNTSWKTIDSRFTFADPNNPFNNAYPLYYEFVQPKGQYIADFVGVKIGDVNNSYVATTSSNKSSDATITASNDFLAQNENANIEFRVTDIETIDGAQLEFNIDGLKNVHVSSDVLSDNQFDYHVDGNKLYLTITPDVELRNLDDALFSINGITLKNGFVSEMISFSKDRLNNEVYHDLKPVSLRQNWIENSEFAVNQNNPNPWNEKTVINYSIPRDGQVKIILSDIKGSRILNQNVHAYKGMNSFNLSSEVIGNDTGVFFYEIIFEGVSKHGKMLRIK